MPQGPMPCPTLKFSDQILGYSNRSFKVLVSLDVVSHRPRAVLGLELREHNFFFRFVVVVHKLDLIIGAESKIRKEETARDGSQLAPCIPRMI